MHVAQIRKYDVANGPGIRASLFVSGCTHRCPGCFNEAYQQFQYGSLWTQEKEDEFLALLKDENLGGVTILGGEPLDQIQDDGLLNLVKRIKQETTLNLWLYSGYTFEEIITHPKRLAILSYSDVLVDGKFELKQRDWRLRFRGSKNQRLIDVPASLAKKQAILLPEE